MSGDVQPRKRKDKKRKKDELGLEEPRGTAAVFGEGDVFMHSHHDHGTGGHWCAKVIFFSLLAILVTLIGLIILENRGLSELEANAVESRYSGVLEGWLEDAPDDDHHDEHTLELNHHGDDDDDHDEHGDDEHALDEEDEHDDEHDSNDENGHDDEDEELEQDEEENDAHSDEDDKENNEDADEDDQLDDENSQEQEIDNAEDEDEEPNQDTYEDDEDENDDLQEVNDDDDDFNADENEEDDNNSNEIDKNESEENFEENENQDDEDEDEHEEEAEADDEVEVEKLEKEASEEEHEPISTELPALPEDNDDDDDKDQAESDEKEADAGEDDSGIEDEDEQDEFLEADDDDDKPPVERITAPAGKPFVEVEEDESSEQPPDTLEEEEEYEKRQEELRREEAQASHMWLKLGVGAALLVATHAVMRRATHSRDTPEKEEHGSREETPVVDRRLTLIPEEPPVFARKTEEVSRPIVEKSFLEKVAPVVKSIPIKKQESEEEEEEIQPSEDEEEIVITTPTKPTDKELYSEDEEDEEVEEEEEIPPPKKEVPKQVPVVAKKPEPKPEPEPEPDEEAEDDEDPEDVEIIGDEQLEEELEEEGDEEEISDVDDTELLSRLEAKYGRLPEPERPGQKHKDGGNSIEDMWPGEPSDAYWRQQLDAAERELREFEMIGMVIPDPWLHKSNWESARIMNGSWDAAADRVSVAGLRDSARGRYITARALDLSAEAKRDNRLLSRAIAAYLELLKMNERLSDRKLLEVARRALDRIQFRGNYLNAEPVYRLLIRRFPNDSAYRNNLTISFLMANRVDLAEDVIKETLQHWPNDRVALAHYGFVLKTKHNKYEEAAMAFKKALEGDTGPANEPRFYYHYGDSLLLLGRNEEANEVHKRGAKLGHFLSPSQRSLYNVDRLKSAPWWKIEQTPYLRLAKALEKSWKEILKEGEAAKALYEKEKEGLKERGEWSQLDLFVQGREIPGRCKRAPVTCSVVKSEPAAAGCRRGQVKFSAMAAGTHVRAHVGPTNCRLRMHLGLSNTKDTYIRVDKETRQWQEGKVFMFDDSFEHEVWHNGTGSRLVLIVDVWHPNLTAQERLQLPAI